VKLANEYGSYIGTREFGVSKNFGNYVDIMIEEGLFD